MNVFGDPLEMIWKNCVFGLCGVHVFLSPDIQCYYYQYRSSTKALAQRGEGNN